MDEITIAPGYPDDTTEERSFVEVYGTDTTRNRFWIKRAVFNNVAKGQKISLLEAIELLITEWESKQ